MRILHLISSVGPSYGGPSRQVPELCRALAYAGCQVELAVTNADNNRNEMHPLTTDFFVPGFKLSIFPRLGKNRFQFSPKLLEWLCENVDRFDIVHTHGLFSYAPSFAQFHAWIKRVPFVVSPMGMLNLFALRTNAASKAAWLRVIEMPLLKKSQVLAVLNKAEQRQLERYGLSEKGRILSNGIRWEPLKDNRQKALCRDLDPMLPGARLMVALGRLDPIKGLEDLIKAFALIVDSQPEVVLVLAGPDNCGYGQTLRTLIKQLNLDGRVCLPGIVQGVSKQSLLDQAEIFVQASYSEGFSASILEAMASGKACIITEGCNFSEASEAGVVKMVPNEISALSKAIQLMLNQEQLRNRMGESAREWVGLNYSWDSVAHQALNIYNEILQK